MLPLNFNFAQDVIDRQAGEHRAGLLFIDTYGHRRDYTFAEISEQSQRYAAALRALGVEQGERVLLCTSNTAKTLFMLLALVRLGAVAVPCAEDVEPEELLERARRTAAATVIANRKRRRAIETVNDELPASMRYVLVGEACEGWARIDTLAAAAKPYAGITTQSMDMAYVFDDTVLDYGALLEARNAAGAVLAPESEDHVWTSLPMGSEMWLTYVQAPWWCGAAAIVHEAPFDARERLDLVRELQVSVLCQPPHEFAAQVDLPDVDRFRLPHLRRCVATGDVDPEIQRRWAERFGLTLYAAV